MRLLVTFLFLAAAMRPALADAPSQEYVRVWAGPKSGEKGQLRPRTGSRIFAEPTGNYYHHIEGDAKSLERGIKQKKGIVLTEGTKVAVVVHYMHQVEGKEVPTLDCEVKIESGPNKGKVARVYADEVVVRMAFTLKPGTEAWLTNFYSPRKWPDDPVPVIKNIPMYNTYLKMLKDKVDDEERAKAFKKKGTPMVKPGTKLRVKQVACTADRYESLKLDGPAVQVEVLEGGEKGWVGWVFPELVARKLSDMSAEALKKSH